jgi:2-polyprenyl-3-methyl-5-hydroxy-6-metoxy-1,4-benzoquinol methylase
MTDLSREIVDSELETIESCPLCGHFKFKKVFTKFSLAVVRCKRCSLLFTNPRLLEIKIMSRYSDDYFFKEYLPVLEASLRDSDLTPIKNQFRLFLQIIERFYAPGKKLLEIGCGAGFFLYFARQAGWQVEGIEYIGAAAKYAQARFNLAIHQGRFEDFSFNEEFDLIALLETLEHLREPYLSLKRIYRWLKPGGLLLLSTPDYQSLSRFFLGLNWAVLSPADHLFYFTRNTISRLLNAAGFEIIGLESFMDFNPRASHAPQAIRCSFYSLLVKHLNQSKIMSKMRERAFNELIRADDFSTGRIRFYPRSKRLMKRFKKAGYNLLKAIFHGDRLLALAQKPVSRKRNLSGEE